MKRVQRFNFILLLCLAALTGCESKDKNELQHLHAPGSSGYYYLQGLETSNPQEKLELYNKGLSAVTNKKDTSLVSLLDGKIYASLRVGRHDSLQYWIDSLIATAQFQNDLYYEAKGFYRKSEAFRRKNPEEQFKNAYLSRNLYLKYGDTSLAGRRSLDMANAQLGLGDFVGSQETATEALRYLDMNRDPHYVGSAHNVLGLSYGAQRLYSEALKEYKMALEYATDPLDSLSYLHNIALLHKDQQNYDEAIKIFEQILESNEAHEGSKLRFRENYAFTRWLQDSGFKSENVLLEVLDQKIEKGDREGLIASYSHLSDYYREVNKERSKHYAQEYLETATALSYPVAEVEALKRLIAVSEGVERDEYLERFLFLNDSLKEASTKLRYQFAKIRFDEERKEQQIDLLEAENLTQSLRTERLRTRNIVSSLTALLVILISLAFFYYIKQRGKREKIKQIYLTESRISKRIHDELANDIYHVMSSIEPVAPPPVVDKLEKIYQRTRDFSRENREIPTGEDFLPGLLNMLSGAVPQGTKLIIRGENSINWNSLKSEKKIVIYRVLQEMMVNMKKHSEAKLVALIFSTEKDHIKISYSDNGIGVIREVIENGNGIKNLKDRLKTINGNVIFETLENGLKANILIPLGS